MDSQPEDHRQGSLFQLRCQSLCFMEFSGYFTLNKQIGEIEQIWRNIQIRDGNEKEISMDCELFNILWMDTFCNIQGTQ